MLKISKKLFWAFGLLSVIAIIIAISCSGADATKPEDMKIDLGKELGSGKNITPELAPATNTNNNTFYILVAGGDSATSHFFTTLLSEPSMTSYSSGNGAGITVTDILKVIRADISATPENEDITGIATAVKNDAGGVYRVDLAITDANINRVQIEFSYKLKAITTSTSAPKTTHTKIGVNNDATNWTSLDLTNQIAGSTENSLFGKTYVIGTAANINAEPTSFSNGLITNNILTVTVPSNGGAYKLWIY